jgi:undecaprenyl-diphosphatase
MEQQLQILINREWTAPWADRLLSFFSSYGAWAPWLLGLLVLGIVFGDFKLRATLLTMGLAVGLCDGIGVNLLKHAVGRPRPSQSEPGVRFVELGKPPAHFPKIAGILSEPAVSYPLGTAPPENHGGIFARPESDRHLKGLSFPSGHAANNLAAATVLILFYPRRGWLYLPIALLIGYARIYTGSHWPLDVLAGFALGMVCGWMAVLITKGLWLRWGTHLFPKQAAEYGSLVGVNSCSS